MGSRIFWVVLAGIALVAGIAVRGGDGVFSWGHDATRDRAIEARIESSIDRSFDRMEVVGSDGKSIDVAPETKRALGEAVGRLVTAETQLALAKVRHADEVDIQRASARRDAARAEVDRLKDDIEHQKQLSESDRDVMREQIQRKIREDIRESVKEAVRS